MIKSVVLQSKKGHTFYIRLLVNGDAPKLLIFANTLIGEDTFVMLSGKKMTLKEEIAYVKESLKLMNKGDKIRLVVTKGDEIIGSAEIRRGERRKKHVGEIGISILKPYRGEGIGKKLIEMLISEAKRMGLRMLLLHCFENNDVARSLYKNFGFIESGIVPGVLQYRSRYVGEVTMYLYV